MAMKELKKKKKKKKKTRVRALCLVSSDKYKCDWQFAGACRADFCSSSMNNRWERALCL